MTDRTCLILYYSLTGQAEKAALQAAATASAAGWTVRTCRISMTAPEDALARPLKIADSKKWTQGAQKGLTVPVTCDPPDAVVGRYDAVLLFTNTWGDNPSVPVRSFLESPAAQALLSGTPFGVYVICRRLWEKNLAIVRSLGEAAGGRFLGGEAFMHPGGQIGSLIQTISYLHRSDDGLRRFLGLPLPRYGLSDAAIARLPDFTMELLNAAGKVAAE
ncbi:hypothetical protein VVT58_18960 (plasmid) [Sphingobium sp. SJ10-10]|uniref:hypothetical protein n=1 Tax=Sphingobium sp. SJ10-10 TaxID=3114999 RepID=UPI002E1813B5|nr:hypothetical protein [Sphingobium sp. SJ10-10]